MCIRDRSCTGWTETSSASCSGGRGLRKSGLCIRGSRRYSGISSSITGINIIVRSRAACPVSYTHLDVYKRQASKQIIPAVVKYTKVLADSINAVKTAGVDEVTVQKKLLEETSALLKQTQKSLNALIEAEAKANAMEEGKRQAKFYHEKVVLAMEELRVPVDELEMIVDKEMWPMPSYGDLIFEV